MATVSELVKYFADWTETRPEEGTVRARHLREAGLLPSTGRGKGGAQVSAMDCAVYLVSWLASERAINGPFAVPLYAKLMPHSVIGDLKNLKPQAQSKLLLPTQRSNSNPALILPNTPFVEILAKFIEWARKPEGYKIIEDTFETVGCTRDWPFGFIKMRSADGGFIQQDYRPPPRPDQTNKIEVGMWQMNGGSGPGAIGIDAHIPASIICYLASILDEFDIDPSHLADVELPDDATDTADKKKI